MTSKDLSFLPITFIQTLKPDDVIFFSLFIKQNKSVMRSAWIIVHHQSSINHHCFVLSFILDKIRQDEIDRSYYNIIMWQKSWKWKALIRFPKRKSGFYTGKNHQIYIHSPDPRFFYEWEWRRLIETLHEWKYSNYLQFLFPNLISSDIFCPSAKTNWNLMNCLAFTYCSLLINDENNFLILQLQQCLVQQILH